MSCLGVGEGVDRLEVLGNVVGSVRELEQERSTVRKVGVAIGGDGRQSGRKVLPQLQWGRLLHLLAVEREAGDTDMRLTEDLHVSLGGL